MKKMETDIVVIGGGPAGLAAALKAAESNLRVIILERSRELGGILPQCIHLGFGNFIFEKMYTGPEYSQIYINNVKNSNIEVKTDTMVIDIKNDKKITASNKTDGLFEIQAKAVVLAMGCRERTRSQIFLPGSRPSGIYTAGTSQRLINVDGIMPGKKIVILGSGDVGLIMARRFLLEGAEVVGVYEIMPYPSGLTRNIVQCLEDYEIPLFLNHTVVDIHGKKRIEGVTVAKLDESMIPIEETKKFVSCDCLILAVGLIPENELSKKISIEIDDRTGGPVVDEKMHTSVDGFFACGNVVHIHDIVDDVTNTSEIAGSSAAEYIKKGLIKNIGRPINPGENVIYIVPQILHNNNLDSLTLYLRVKKQMINATITLSNKKKVLLEKQERILRPPEMVKIKIPNKIFKDKKYDELIVDVRESNE
jgi:NADPH-dependent 2,4-dienoyl-CoA reductase/sulfur reductase-like enzyme